MKTLTIEVPDEFESPSHIVVLARGDGNGDYDAYGYVVSMEDGKVTKAEETGGGTIVYAMKYATNEIREREGQEVKKRWTR